MSSYLTVLAQILAAGVLIQLSTLAIHWLASKFKLPTSFRFQLLKWSMILMVLVPIGFSLIPRQNNSVRKSVKIISTQKTYASPQVAAQSTSVTTSEYATFAHFLAAVYSLGLLYFVAKLLLAIREAGRLRSNAIRSTTFRDQPVYETSDVPVPISLGIIKPIILIPHRLFEVLRPDEVQMIVAHEINHIQRGDHLFKIVSLLIEAIWFFSPATYLLNRQFEIDMEISCDDQVIGLGFCTPKKYGELLLHLSTSATSQLGWSGLGISNSFLKRRIEAMKTGILKKRPLSQFACASLMLISSLGISAFAVDSVNVQTELSKLSGLRLGYRIEVKGTLAKEEQKSELTVDLGKIVTFSLKQVNIQMTINENPTVGRQVDLTIIRLSDNQVLQQTALPFDRTEMKFEIELNPKQSDIHQIKFELVDFASRK